jgi:hypothetical protein
VYAENEMAPESFNFNWMLSPSFNSSSAFSILPSFKNISPECLPPLLSCWDHQLSTPGCTFQWHIDAAVNICIEISKGYANQVFEAFRVIHCSNSPQIFPASNSKKYYGVADKL